MNEVRHYGPLSDKIVPIPIREDVTVLVYGLPLDLKPEEAEKVGRVVLALAVAEDGGSRL